MSKKGPVNYYKFAKKTKIHNPNYKKHLIDVPFRMLCVAASGGGKTLFFLDLLHQMSGTFEEVIVCTRCKDEPLYNLLAEKCKGMVRFYESQIPDLDEFKDDCKDKNRIICFDDLILSKTLQARIGEYYIRSRKYNISCVYLSQSYFAIPKIIRQQANYIIIKKISSTKDLKMMIREYSLGINLDKLLELYKSVTSQDVVNFLMIDLQNMDYRYRFNYMPMSIDEN